MFLYLYRFQLSNMKQISPKIDNSPPEANPVKVQLIEIASQAFSSYGIKNVTMDEIASQAGISKRTLYQLFADKEALLYECVLSQQERLHRFIQEVLKQTSNVLEIILHSYKYTIRQYHNTDKRFFEDIQKYPKVYKVFLRGQERDSNETLHFFQKGVNQGLFRNDVNFEIVNILVREQFNYLLHSDINLKYPFVEVFESIMFTYLRGISTSKGLEKLEQFIRDYREEELTLNSKQ